MTMQVGHSNIAQQDDTTLDFDQAVYNARGNSNGYIGGILNGQYIYFVAYNGDVLCYDDKYLAKVPDVVVSVHISKET